MSRSNLKYFLFVFIILITFSCKKEIGTNKADFNFTIAGKIYSIDTLRVAKITSNSGNACVSAFKGKSKDGKCLIEFECKNNIDSVVVGQYIISNLPQGLNPQKIVSYILIQINDPVDANRVWYYQPKEDFVINLTALNGSYVKGNFSGHMTGGFPVPGGFGVSTYSNIRTSAFKGEFDTKFFEWQ